MGGRRGERRGRRLTTIRSAQPQDAAIIARLILAGSAERTWSEAELDAECGRPEYRTAVEAVLASPACALLVAERDGTVIATLQLTLIPGVTGPGRVSAKLTAVHVAAAERGRGLGGALVEHALALAKGRGATVAELASNKVREDAHRFYRRLGFRQSHEGFKKPL